MQPIAQQQDWNALPDEEFRRIFRAWVDENCPHHLRFMRKQRPVFDEVADWYHALARRGWLSPVWPQEYGGMGLNAAKHIINVEETLKQIDVAANFLSDLAGNVREDTMIRHQSEDWEYDAPFLYELAAPRTWRHSGPQWAEAARSLRTPLTRSLWSRTWPRRQTRAWWPARAGATSGSWSVAACPPRSWPPLIHPSNRPQRLSQPNPYVLRRKSA